jgi:hypothetical protein
MKMRNGYLSPVVVADGCFDAIVPLFELLGFDSLK